MTKYFDKYIIVAPGSDYGRAMWADLADNDDCFFFEYPIDTHNRLKELVHHIHFSFGINNRIKLPFQNIWSNSYLLNTVHFKDEEKYCIILPDVSACRIDVQYLSKLKKKQNIELVLVNVNVIGKKEKLVLERWKYFTKIFSFDIADCRRYGCIYHPTIYSSPKFDVNMNYESNAFFVGSYTRDRYKKLVDLYKGIIESGGIADFNIVGVPKNEKQICGIKYNRPLSYGEVLKRAQLSNCIVEIMNPGQKGLTLRAMEAICMNKKLLTDNSTVKDLKYYKSGFIQYCEMIVQADINFMIKDDIVNYEYDGEFSPNRLIAHIEQSFVEEI